MTSARGNTVSNQFIITDNGDEYFQSYKSIIARKKIASGEYVLTNLNN